MQEREKEQAGENKQKQDSENREGKERVCEKVRGQEHARKRKAKRE